jgi:N6-adenosine-specific RNA methylase IME4
MSQWAEMWARPYDKPELVAGNGDPTTYTNRGNAMNLVKYEAACHAVAECKTVDEAKDIHDKAVAMRAYARQAKNKDLEADAVEIRMRATRRLDQLRRAQKQTVGLATGKEGKRKSLGLETNPSDRPTLASQGIDKNLAHQGRVLGKLSDEQFEAVVAVARETVTDAVARATAAAMRSAAREPYAASTAQGCTVAGLDQLIAAGEKYAVIYADPPWSFQVYSGKGKARSAERHYDTLSLDAIKALPVADLAADDCALLLWAVMPQLPEALKVIASWGFTYKTAGFVWVKENRSGDGLFTGMGYWTRANAEVCLLATKGSPARQAKDVHQIIRSPVGEHSRKPDEAQVRIERLLPGPYLELFGRRAVPGWTVWGNEIERSMFHQEIPEFAHAVAN